ncbi:hypothetical protein FOG14_11345, partial [Neisseria meningitidis]|nr:hypothetical protein [Neisseria meningitidis]
DPLRGNDESIHTETCTTSFPRSGNLVFEFQSFPINCLSIECLDSRLRGNDESIHTETCIPSFPRTYIPPFPQKWESSFLSFSHSR